MHGFISDFELDFAACGRIKADEQLCERAFAAAVFAGKRDDLARVHLRFGVGQDDFFFVIRKGEVFGGERCITCILNRGLCRLRGVFGRHGEDFPDAVCGDLHFVDLGHPARNVQERAVEEADEVHNGDERADGGFAAHDKERAHAERDDEHADAEEVIEKADGALQNAEFADVLLLLRVCIPHALLHPAEHAVGLKQHVLAQKLL